MTIPWELTDINATLAYSARVDIHWNVTYVEVDRDGLGVRKAIGVNGQLPIPPVYATVGDTLFLQVHNSLDKTTSIHAHGILQNNTNFMDGAAMVTQCGIPPGQSLTYEYYLHQPGTFWLHGHDHHQNSDGLRTALVVYDREAPPYKYDDEYLFSLEDWFALDYDERIQSSLNLLTTVPAPSTFPTGLINGVLGNFTKPIAFAPKKTYRIRLVNMASTLWFQFSIAGHKLSLIEADGVYSNPLPVDGLEITPGQRYSVLVTADDTDQFNFNYNITMHASYITSIKDLNPHYFMGIVEYRNDAPLKNVTMPDNFVIGKDIHMSALSGKPLLPADRQISLTIGGGQFAEGIYHALINNITYAQAKVPTLYSALTMGELSSNSTIYGLNTNAIILRYLEHVEVVIRNTHYEPHPIHLHGHSFQVIEYGPLEIFTPSFVPLVKPSVDPNIREIRYTGPVPMSRDSILVPQGQYIKIRFQADNPGAWVLHCHLDLHFGLGMAATFVAAPELLQGGFFKVPSKMLEQCQAQGIAVSGNAAGNQGFDMTGLPEIKPEKIVS
ncbi:ferroxidase fet3 [Coemansia sp. Benny D115]|nr:ferroxidase fet3 [Coemansia sp. Benny D115]